MIKDKDIWAYENAYLDKVVDEIKNQIDIGMNAADRYKSEAIALQKSMWEDAKCTPSSLFDLESVAQINQIQMDLANKASIHKFSSEKVDNLKRMQKSPYFCRIDFAEKDEETADKIYIGMHNLITDDMHILVYDWRAPISGMFYDFEIGPSSYSCPAGLIEGQILLKRQYKIEDSKLVYMFDSSLNIGDAMLQEILGKSTDIRMRTIVTSIQKEQNIVIRNSEDKILIVEGPAGSGKTSIALHRAAYLLYKYRDNLKSENILIFSPNHVFEDYISHVLPELGEENIRRSTFADFFNAAFLANLQTETMNQQMEYVLNAYPNDIRLDCIRFKSSPLFLTVLNRYAAHIENGMVLQFKDLFYNNSLLFSADDMVELYKKADYRLPYANRFQKIRQRLFSLLDENQKKRRENASDKEPLVEENPNKEQESDSEYQLAKSIIFKMTTINIFSLYIDLFKNIESFMQTGDNISVGEYRSYANYTLQELLQGFVSYEDLAPMIYLKTMLYGENAAASIKHIIIDEAQDYTAVQYEIFKTVFKNANMTILGDINQTVNGYMNIGNFDIIPDTFNTMNLRRVTLTKSYRSSKELADFCKALLLSPADTQQLDRHGAKPKVIQVSNSRLYQKIAEDIIDLKAKGYKLIAVICKTASSCKAVYHSIRSSVDISLISNQNEVYYGDVVAIPSYLAKGLEFDAVLVHSIEDTDYSMPEDRRLLYTICTRALHELYMYYSDTMSGFMSGIDEGLYTIENLTR